MTQTYCLALETSVGPLSAALFRDGVLISAAEGHKSLGKAEELSTLVKELLDGSGISPVQLELVAVSNGPGSYTGIRVGLSFAKGLCKATGAELRMTSLFDGLGAGTNRKIVAIKTGAKEAETMTFPDRVRSKHVTYDDLQRRILQLKPTGADLVVDARLKEYVDFDGALFTSTPFSVYIGMAALSESWTPAGETAFLQSHF